MDELQQFPTDIIPMGRQERYDWDKLLNGSVWAIDPKEIHCTPVSFYRNANVVARKRGMKISARNIQMNFPDTDKFYIQAVPR